MERPRVLIVGGGFGGLYCARALTEANVQITLVDRRNHHLFQPLLYQVATAALNPSDIASPLRQIFAKEDDVTVILGNVSAIDTTRRVVQVDDEALSYDALVLATGVSHTYFGHEEYAALAPGLKTIDDALEIRRRIFSAFESAERAALDGDQAGAQRLMTFVIVGGGPTGVELAGAISDISRLYMTRDFRHIDTTTASVLILEGSPHVLAAYPEDLQQSAINQLAELGVQVRTNAYVSDIQPGYVMVGDERIESVCTLWAAGVQASPLGKLLASSDPAVELDKKGCVLVDPYLNPPNHPEIFICGDLAHVNQDGHQVPGVAQPAIQMGTYAAKRINFILRGKPQNQRPFRYFDKGDMATIGRKAAIARVSWPFHAHISGILAWLTWLMVHIFFLIGFRNRWAVFTKWAYTYIQLKDGVRLIVGSQDLPGWDSLAALPGPLVDETDVSAPSLH
jgi:NADH:ubiquinone reductase (H+-translocating)